MTTDPGPIVLRPGGGRRITLPDRGAVVTLKAGGSETAGRLSIVESAPDPGAPGLALHRHRRSDEALYVLEGTVAVRVGEQVIRAAAGSFVFVPRGTAHMFWNPARRPARVLVIFAPAGVERFLEETAHVFAAGAAPDPAVLRAIRSKHDIEMVEGEGGSPPPGPGVTPCTGPR